MKTKRFLFLNLALWELIRLVALLVVLSITLREANLIRTEMIVLLLVLGSGNLLVPAVSLVVYVRNRTDSQSVIILIAGKALELFPCLLGILAVLGRMVRGFSGPPFNLPLVQGLILAAIFLIDLLFLVILLSFKVEREPHTTNVPDTSLPDVRETEIADDSQ
ncbi:MAG TPA: hypothetical protein ENN69_07205 [Spirochaetia bacterium]|nr:hypothetical protein [Spirochaetia bacterium]